MSSRHQDVEYIPLDSGPTEPNLTRRTSVSAKYAGHLFLAALFFTGIFVGAGICRWFTVPTVITTLIPSSVVLDPVHYEPVVTLFDSFVDMCVPAYLRDSLPLTLLVASNHLSPALYPSSAATKHSERAVVTSLYTESYSVAVATLGHALTRVNTDARKVLIYLPERISKTTICYLQEVGWELFPVDLIEPPDHGKGVWPAFIDQYTKLRVWTLDTIGVKAAVYLDADILVKQNFDELFELPFVFAAVPDVFTDDRGFTINFNAGVMAFKPDSKVFTDMLSKVESAHFDRIAAEQSYLNLYYGSQVLKLPHVYNGNLAIKWKAAPYWDAIQEQLRIIHYTLVKPFDSKFKCAKETCTDEEVFSVKKHRDFLGVAEQSWEGVFKDEVREWGVVFEEMMKTVGDRCTA